MHARLPGRVAHAGMLALLLFGMGPGLAAGQGQATTPASAAPSAGKFKPELGVVFPAARASELLAQCSRSFPRPEGAWTPSEKQIRELERRLSLVLADALARLRLEFPREVPDYIRQYGGVVVAGRRLIYVNGFHRRIVDGPAASPDWKAKPVVVCDGGASYWQAAYDPERRTFVVFRFDDGTESPIVFNGVA